MLRRVLSLVGHSRAQKTARELLLSLEALPDYQAFFDATNSGDLSSVLAVLAKVPELPEILRPSPGEKLAGALFSIESGHTLHLRVGLDAQGQPLGGGRAERHNLCVTRLGPDLWGWYLERAGDAALLHPDSRLLWPRGGKSVAGSGS